MTINLSATLPAPGQISLDPASTKAGSPMPASAVPQWLTTLLRDLPKPTEYQFAAEYSRAIVDYCLETWRVASSAEPPTVEEASAEFRSATKAATDLSHRQVDQLCKRTFGV